MGKETSLELMQSQHHHINDILTEGAIFSFLSLICNVPHGTVQMSYVFIKSNEYRCVIRVMVFSNLPILECPYCVPCQLRFAEYS